MNRGNTAQRWDAIVVGAGHNGLVTAAYLAKSGLRTLVLERRALIGGAAGTEQVFPGVLANTGAADAGLFLPRIIDDLLLENYGLTWIESPALVFTTQLDGPGLTIWRQAPQTIAEIDRHSQADAAAYPRFLQFVEQAAAIVREMMTLIPPDLPQIQTSDIAAWLRPALKLRGLGKRDMMEFIRILPMPVSDFLDEWFESSSLKAALGASGVTASFAGPRSAGTTLMFLYQAAGGHIPQAARFVRGGAGALCTALAHAAGQYSAEIRTQSGVAQFLFEEQRLCGVILESGERIKAQIVVSNADPRHTFFTLLGARRLPVRAVREVKNIRMTASLARIDLALDELPVFAGRPQAHAEGALSGHILICPTLDDLERAFDEAKYGRWSTSPVLKITIPTINDPGLSPTGMHLMSVDVYYTPFELSQGSWDDQKELLQNAVLDLLENYAPGFHKLVAQSRIRTPLDLQRDLGLTAGDIYHGQMGLDQLLMLRPFPGSARYRTPIANLYLCGSGAHPGGGLTGAPGYNAARRILSDFNH
jgi:phytoene dehydrogenase-like protein